MNRGVQIIVNGITYSSILDCSKAFGCSTAFVRNSIKKANGNQKILDELILGYKSIKKKITVCGYEFPSLRELVSQTGISEKRLRTIRKHCKSDIEFGNKILDESVGFYILGNWYWCIKCASHELGINEKTLKTMLKTYDYSQNVLDTKVKDLLVSSETN